MFLSLMHSTELEPEMITLPLSQVRLMAQSINRGSLCRLAFIKATAKICDRAVVRKFDVSIDLPYWEDFVDEIAFARSDPVDPAAPEAGQFR